MRSNKPQKEDRREQLALCFAFSVFSLILFAVAMLSLGGAIFSNVIPDPPWLELPDRAIAQDIAAPLTSEDPPTVFAARSPRLDAAGPRIVWAAAVALIQLGQAIFMLLIVRVLWTLRTAPFFSDEVGDVVQLWWAAAIPIAIGSVTRALSDGWVASSFGLPLADTRATSFSVIDVPGIAYLALFGLAFVWARGRELQAFNDEAV